MKANPAPKPTRKKYEPVDDRLLGTAGRCFIEDGFGFGIDDILAQSQVAKMSLYVKFQSKYGLIERLLEMARTEWMAEIARVAGSHSLQGADKILWLLQILCTDARDTDKRVGLIGQALLEFPRTGKTDETHQKKDLVHEKARQLLLELLQAVEQLCRNAGVENPLLAAQQVLLLANGYLIIEPLLGKKEAVRLIMATAQALLHSAPPPTALAQEPMLAQAPAEPEREARKLTKERLAEIKKAHPNAYEPWTEEDDLRLKEQLAAGSSVQDLIRDLHRDRGGIRSRLPGFDSPHPLQP